MMVGNYPKSLLEAMATHVFLGKLGYKTEEIFFHLSVKDVCVLIRADGKEGSLRVTAAELPEDQMIRKWKELIAEWNTGGTMTQEEKDNLFHSSKIFANSVHVMGVLFNAGFDRWNV